MWGMIINRCWGAMPVAGLRWGRVVAGMMGRHLIIGGLLGCPVILRRRWTTPIIRRWGRKGIEGLDITRLVVGTLRRGIISLRGSRGWIVAGTRGSGITGD